MSLPQNGAAICPDCGTRVESTSTDDIGCVVCLLRAGLDDLSGPGEVDADSAPAGNQFGTYAIAHHDDGTPWELGRGAMGITFRAVDTTLNRAVALKIIHTGLAAGTRARERFMRGARVAAALRHPNVATIYHFGIHEETGQFFYAMELVEGETLEERVLRMGPLDTKTTIAIAQQVAVALAEAEKRGLVHRDLKPANLMLVSPNEQGTSPRGRYDFENLTVKIIDFGLAKAIAAQDDPMSLTQGGFVGTPAFASPEQFGNASLDIRSDIYSLGATLWFALTGKTPFAGRNVNEIRTAQMAGILPLEQLKAARARKIFGSILQSMLAHEPAARPSVAVLSERLRRAERRMRLTRQRIYVMTATAIVLLMGIGYWLGNETHKASDSATGAVEQKSLAVIPFVDLSRESDSHFFAHGIRVGVTARLSKISQLKVVTSNLNAGGDDTPESVQQLASSLDVQMLLQGTMKKDGDKFELKVRLTEALTGHEVWSQSYERTFSGVEEIERDVAAQTAAALGLNLSGPQQRAVSNKGTANARAYEAYLKGRYVWLQRNNDAYAQAKEYFEQAIALDPNYANAYAGLGDAYQFLGGYASGMEQSAEFYAKAKEALQRALALNPDLAEAHASIALIAMNYDWDWALADREYKRAISLDPNNALIHDWYAEFERTVGRAEESLHQIEVARQLDPFSPLINSDVGKLLYFARHYQAATAQLEQAIRMDPNFDQPHGWLGYSYASAGKFDDALREFGKLWPEGRSGWQTGYIAYVYGMQGKNAEAARMEQLIKRDIQRGARGDNFPLLLACIGAGDKDGAFAALESEYAAHTTAISSLKLAPYFDALRSDPRFLDLLRRAHLVP
jgi:serine/threonine protein kinase/Tfp pilus assembly protein PilF